MKIVLRLTPRVPAKRSLLIVAAIQIESFRRRYVHLVLVIVVPRIIAPLWLLTCVPKSILLVIVIVSTTTESQSSLFESTTVIVEIVVLAPLIAVSLVVVIIPPKVVIVVHIVIVVSLSRPTIIQNLN